jgi:hypothetical protein
MSAPKDDVAPELTSVVAFGEYMLDNDRTEFTFEEATELSEALGFSIATPVVRALREIGFTMRERACEKRVRGFHANSHDRWTGPGACKTHGGSGWEQITGFAGQRG